MEPTKLEIFVGDREAAFVCGAWGHVTVEMLEQIERDMREDCVFYIPDDTETITVTAVWYPDEYEGHVCINAGYWDLTLLSTKQFPEEPKE